jgi:uncharacterized protein (DUF885 family)
MRHKLFLLLTLSFFSCVAFSQKEANPQLAALFNNFYEDNLKLSPLTATSIGDNRYNDQLPIMFTEGYRQQLKAFYAKYLAAINGFNRGRLNTNDQLSYDVFKRDMQLALDGLKFKTNLIPFDQFNGIHLMLGQYGSGSVIQPFKTVTDYENWLKRAGVFPAIADSAIVYFRKGIEQNYVLPKALVVKMVPQVEAFVTTDPTKSVFYGPINNMPATFSDADKQRLTAAYVKLINEQISPSYKKLAEFIKNEYLPRARATSGIGAMPEGAAYYRYRIQQMTTTNKTPEEIFNTGLSEVKRIQTEMEKVKASVGFTGTLKEFFDYMRNDPKFKPYKTAEEVLNAYRAVQQKVEPHLPTLFKRNPKTPFEIRQTEAFRAASAAAQYFGGSADGTRPGIFYVPIVDPLKYTTAKTNLFLHEAIPGHHYQISLQRENTALPAFRRFGGNSAYSEGWGLYAESLGYGMGLYTDPFQHMYALGDEIHRAIRLVVDAGMHSKGWTRERAIQYMMDNEPISEQGATAEIERYMAMPAQALSYKIGELKLQELRRRYEKQLGTRFNLAEFHDEILKDGALPLNVLERKMDAWAKSKK